MRRARIGLGAAALAVSSLLQPAAGADARPLVVAVSYPLAYFAERLAGDAAEVRFPVPAGRDPAFWRPGVADISTFQSADLIVLNGAGFAAWTARTTLPRSRTVDTSRGFAGELIQTETVTHSHGDDGEHSHTGIASFTWLDQALALRQARAIATALKRRGIGDPQAVDERLEALAADLGALDEAAKALQPLAAGRVLVATHPRYQYLARAYGLTVHAFAWGAGEAPDQEQLAALAAVAEQRDARVLLWEAAPPDVARRAVRDLGLADVVFPTLASAPAEGDYLSAFAAAIRDLEAVLRSLPPG